MDVFPDDLNMQNCMNIMKTKQKEMIKNVRAKLASDIGQAINICMKSVKLKFPENLWNEQRVILTKELLERFGELHIGTTQKKYNVTTFAHSEENIPNEIEFVRIDFWK